MAEETTNNMVPKSGNAGKSSSEATNDKLNSMFEFRIPTELSSIEPYPIPEGFGSDEWNEEKSSAIRIWRGIDGLPSTVRYPDGVSFKRDLTVWPESNGYNLAIFELNGEPRLTTLKDLKFLQQLNPLVKPEDVVYRKDFIAYMDFEMGVLRNSEGKLMDARPGARRGKYDQIMDRGLTGPALEMAKREYVLEAGRYADWLADNDRRHTEFFERGIGYHGEKQSEENSEDFYNRVFDTSRVYPQNEETEFALKYLGSNSSDVAMEILSKNFIGGSADTYLNAVISNHYDALGDFYKDQALKEELLNADISAVAAQDALQGICRRELMAEAGYDMAELRKLSTQEVVEKFNECIRDGSIDELKGGYLDMGYKATQSQCNYLSKNWDNMYLPAEFTAKYSKQDIQMDAVATNDGARKVERLDATKAFDFNTIMIHLKPYLSDKQMEGLTSVEAAFKEAKKHYTNVVLNARSVDGKIIGSVFEGGKVTKVQVNELKAHSLDPKQFADYKAAQAQINKFEPTQWQIDTAKRFMKDEDIQKLNRGELQQAINDNRAEYGMRMRAQAAPEIKQYAASHGLMAEGASYTNEQWAKDSLMVPPTRNQLAAIHKNALEGEVIQYARYQAERGNNKFMDKGEVVHSAALYEAVIKAKERQAAEKANGPMDTFQKNFFEQRHMQVPENTTYKAAREVMLSTLYHERLLGAQNFEMIVNKNIDLGEKLTAKIHVYGMNDAERAEVRKEVAAICDGIRKEERQSKIDNVYVGDNTLFGSVRNFINDYQTAHKGSAKGVEDAIVKAYQENKLTQPGDALVAEKGSYGKAVGHVMASVLPECVGNYTKSMEKFAGMVGEKTAEKQAEGKSGKGKSEGRDEGR